MTITRFLAEIPLWLKIFIVGVALIALVVKFSPKPRPKAVQESTPPIAFVVEVQLISTTVDVLTQGTVEPKREIDVIAQVAGQIIEAGDRFTEGEYFNAREVLIRIDPRDYEFALARAKFQLANAEQALAVERGKVRQAKQEWRDLGNDDANQLFLRKPQLEAVKAQLEAAKADMASAKLNVQRSKITVPFSGRIRTAYVDLGQYVTPGTPIAKVYDTNMAEVRLPLTDRQLALVDIPLTKASSLPRGESAATAKSVEEVGTQVEISAKIGGSQHVWPAVIRRTEASIDTRSRMYYAVAEIENPFVDRAHDGSPPLMVGLFVDAKIKGKQLDRIVKLPNGAVFRRNRILILDMDNKIVNLEVTVIKRDDTSVWIQAALESGDRVVLSQQNTLTPGTVVEPSVINAGNSNGGVK